MHNTKSVHKKIAIDIRLTELNASLKNKQF